MSAKPKKVSTTNINIATKAVRAGAIRSSVNEHSEALYLTSSFIYKNAEEGAKMFSESIPYTYSRYENPNNTMLETRIAKLESSANNIGAITFSSGLAAHLALCLTFLAAGDEMVSARAIFGATHRQYDFWLRKFGINTFFVDGRDLQEWEKAITSKTKIIYLECPSNPLNEIIDIRALAQLIKNINQKRTNKILLVVDNTFATALTQKPLDLGADLVTYSATKLFDGQGRTLAGAVVAEEKFIKELKLFQRCAGSTLSAFNAWIIYKGLETLPIRVEAQNVSALKIAQYLEKHQGVEKVYYPFLKSHPQNKLAISQMSSGGIIVTFAVKSSKVQERKAAWRVIDSLELFSRTSNLGDTRSTVTHPATTTHSRLPEAEKKVFGITENLIRLSIGLENCEDLIADLDKALDKK